MKTPQCRVQLIDVGGHSLHLRCSGSGSPTVVLEPGAGLMSSTLGWIAPAVAQETRVCVYDRAGHGWSEPADSPQDGAQIATDLHTLLERGNVPGPYVLAGHSFGGLYVQSFAAQYPDDVAGLVLVDTTGRKSEATPATSPDDASSYDIMGRVSALLSSTAEVGRRAFAQPGLVRQSAAAVCRRGRGHRVDRQQFAEHDRRVPPGEHLDGSSCGSR